MDLPIIETPLRRDDREPHSETTPPCTEPPGSLVVEVVRSIAGLVGLEADFTRLQASSGNNLPFVRFEWQLAWCQHFLGQDPAIVDQPLFHVMRDDAGSCVAIIPLILTRRRVCGFRVCSIGPLGADPGLTEIRSGLVQPGYEERAAAALHQSLHSTKDWDWIHWAGDHGRFSTSLGRLRGIDWRIAAPDYELDLPPTWEEFRAGLKRNIRESLRKCYNSLRRDGHAFQFKVASKAADVRAALERLFVLHALRAAMPGMVEHPDHFAGNGTREFMQQVCDQFAASEIVRVFELKIGGRIVASRIGFVIGDGLYLYYSGFDPAWADYSVMTTTVAEAIKYAIAEGLDTVNLSPGTDVSKTRWGPREVPYLTAFEVSKRLRSRIVGHAYVKARSGAGLQRWLLQRLIRVRNWN